MNIIDIIKSILMPLNDEIDVSEQYSSFNLQYKIDISKDINLDNLDYLTKNIPTNERWDLSLKFDQNAPIKLRSSNLDIHNFRVSFENEKKFFEHESEDVLLNFKINKCTHDNKIKIYNFNEFDIFIKNISIINLMNLLSNSFKHTDILEFIFLEENLDAFYSKYIFFGYGENYKNRSLIEKKDYLGYFNFSNQEKYPFSPNHFDLVKRSSSNNYISNKFEQLAFIFSIIRIFDITYIRDNCLFYKLNGYKVIEGNIKLDDKISASYLTYLKIYQWIYSTNSSLADKLGLARNIISIYIKDNSLDISENTYHSLLSGYNTYLQDNLNKYIDIREKISDQLILITQKANNIIEIYIGNYQKSNFTFISFFISVFVLRVLSNGQFSNVFTKDATILSFSLILLSIVYFMFSLQNLNGEIVRLKKRYINLKYRFQDLLIEEDINKILRDDKDFNDELLFIKSRRLNFSVLWITTVFIFIATILTLSSYINWHTLINLGK